MKRLIIIVLILNIIFTILYCKKDMSSEREPNDIRENATRINPAKNNTITAEIESINDKDYFIIDTADIDIERAVMNITVEGVKGIDIRLSIFDKSSPKPYKQVNDYMKGYGEKLCGIEVIKGRELLLLVDAVVDNIDKLHLGEIENDNPDYPFIDIKEYELTFEILPQTRTETEPNDIFTQADTITVGEPVKGYFPPFLEQFPEDNYIEGLENYNYYEIDLYKVPEHQNDAFVTIQLSDTPNANSFLVLFGSDYKILEFVDNHGFNHGERILNYTFKEGEPYYIGVMGVHTIKINNEGLYEYELIVDYLDDDTNLEMENNNSPDKANKLTSGMVAGTIQQLDDEDWYEIVIPKIEENLNTDEDSEDGLDRLVKSKLLAEIKLSAIEGLDLTLDISEQGNRISYSYDNTGKSEGEAISNLTVDGYDSIYARVMLSENHRSSYINEDRYILSYRFYYQKENMELEPNNAVHNATPVSINSPITGYINPKRDIDNFLIKLDVSKTYSIQISTVDGVYLQWEMYEKSGTEAPNDKNPQNWEYAVKPKGSYQATFPFKYIGKASTGKEQLILSVKDYKEGLGYNTSQMYTIRVIERSN